MSCEQLTCTADVCAGCARVYVCCSGERSRHRLNFPALAPSAYEAIPPTVRSRLESAERGPDGAPVVDCSISKSHLRGVWRTAVGTYAVVVAIPGCDPTHGGVYSSEERAGREYDRRVAELCRTRGVDPASCVNDATAARERAASGTSVASGDPLLETIVEGLSPI